VPTKPSDPCRDHLHQRHHRAAEGRAAAALGAAGNLPGFEHSHDGFPQEGDLFWSPADWAWTGGLWDALMPTLYHGRAILGYRGRFDPERAFYLLDQYAVRNAFLFPDRAQDDDEGVAAAARAPRPCACAR
jgi:acetyl-CoA synthetase